MAIAFDAFSNVAAATGDLIWNHTPVGTPKGILVFVSQVLGATDEVSGVTYGGVAMTELTGSPILHSTGETGAVYAYFLGSQIPTGTRQVFVDVNASSTKRAGAISLTAAANEDTATVDTDATTNSDALANPSVTLSLGGVNAFAALVGYSGQNDISLTTPLASWTDRLEHDFGSQVGLWYTYNTIGSTDVTAGWTQTAEDAVMIAVAIKAVLAPGPPAGSLATLGAGK